MTDVKPAPMSILQQAQLIDALAARCRMVDGAVAGEAFISLTKQDALDLEALARRLFLIAPYEGEIRRMVTRR